MNYFIILIGTCVFAGLSVESVPISDQVYFYHFANNSQTNGTELKTGQKLTNDINPKLPWKFFIHGWTTSPKVSPWFHTGKKEYFTKGKFNIVFVDWSIPANQSYLQSVINAEGSGNFLGKFLLYLVENNGVYFENIHILGHSLGSHMSGFAGKFVQNSTGNKQKIARITGLDPAGPFYELNSLLPKVFINSVMIASRSRLYKDDAKLVDIIHTDSGKYGMRSSIGHVDFFPNGGDMFQPGCETTNDENCSHARSTKFFVESINNDQFIGRECSNFDDYKNGLCGNNPVANLGEYTNVSARGNFYLITNSEPPYAKGKTVL